MGRTKRFNQSKEKKLVSFPAESLQQTEHPFAGVEYLSKEVTNFFLQLPDPFYVYDLIEMKTIISNNRFIPLLGYEESQVSDDHQEFILNLLHPDDLLLFFKKEKRWEQVGEDGFLLSEFRLRHTDGYWLWFSVQEQVLARDQDGKVKIVAGMAREISYKKTLEDNLFGAQKLIGLGSFDWIAEDNLFFWSEGLYDIFDISPKAGLPQDGFIPFIDPEVRDMVREIFDGNQSQNDDFDLEFTILSKTRIQKGVRLIGKYVKNDVSDIVGITGVIIDITQKKKLEKEMLRYSSELETKTQTLEKVNRELARAQGLMVNRELKMIELKNEIRKLKEDLPEK